MEWVHTSCSCCCNLIGFSCCCNSYRPEVAVVVVITYVERSKGGCVFSVTRWVFPRWVKRIGWSIMDMPMCSYKAFCLSLFLHIYIYIYICIFAQHIRPTYISLRLRPEKGTKRVNQLPYAKVTLNSMPA